MRYGEALARPVAYFAAACLMGERAGLEADFASHRKRFRAAPAVALPALMDALAQFGERPGSGGRRAMCRTLTILTSFLAERGDGRTASLLAQLNVALDDLDRGTDSPLFKPARPEGFGNRAPDPKHKVMTIVLALECVVRLRALNGSGVGEARHVVAGWLYSLGFEAQGRGSGAKACTARTLENWQSYYGREASLEHMRQQFRAVVGAANSAAELRRGLASLVKAHS